MCVEGSVLHFKFNDEGRVTIRVSISYGLVKGRGQVKRSVVKLRF